MSTQNDTERAHAAFSALSQRERRFLSELPGYDAPMSARSRITAPDWEDLSQSLHGLLDCYFDGFDNYVRRTPWGDKVAAASEAFHELEIEGTVVLSKADLEELLRCDTGASAQSDADYDRLVEDCLLRPLSVSMGMPPRILSYVTTTWGRAAIARAITQGILPRPRPRLPMVVDQDPPDPGPWTVPPELRGRLWQYDGPKGSDEDPSSGNQGANGPDGPAHG